MVTRYAPGHVITHTASGHVITHTASGHVFTYTAKGRDRQPNGGNSHPSHAVETAAIVTRGKGHAVTQRRGARCHPAAEGHAVTQRHGVWQSPRPGIAVKTRRGELLEREKVVTKVAAGDGGRRAKSSDSPAGTLDAKPTLKTQGSRSFLSSPHASLIQSSAHPGLMPETMTDKRARTQLL